MDSRSKLFERIDFQKVRSRLYIICGSLCDSDSCLETQMRVRMASPCPCVRPSISPSTWNNSAATGRILMILDFFRKSVKKSQVSLKSDKNKGYFT
jgi:hypothetical protein